MCTAAVKQKISFWWPQHIEFTLIICTWNHYSLELTTKFCAEVYGCQIELLNKGPFILHRNSVLVLQVTTASPQHHRIKLKYILGEMQHCNAVTSQFLCRRVQCGNATQCNCCLAWMDLKPSYLKFTLFFTKFVLRRQMNVRLSKFCKWFCIHSNMLVQRNLNVCKGHVTSDTGFKQNRTYNFSACYFNWTASSSFLKKLYQNWK